MTGNWSMANLQHCGQHLIEAAGEDRNIPVILRADAETPHHFVVTAMDITAQLGFSRLSIATERITRDEYL